MFSPEFREDAVRLVVDSSRPIASVARELQIGEGTLGNWVTIYRRDHAGEEPGLDVGDRARLRELERKYREVKVENEFLKCRSVGRPGSPVSETYEFVDTTLTEPSCPFPVRRCVTGSTFLRPGSPRGGPDRSPRSRADATSSQR